MHQGHILCLIPSSLTEASCFEPMDVDQVVALVEQIEKDIGDIQVLIFNIGANVNFSILETTSRVYRKVRICFRRTHLCMLMFSCNEIPRVLITQLWFSLGLS